jgi:hypothetical protein
MQNVLAKFGAVLHLYFKMKTRTTIQTRQSDLRRDGLTRYWCEEAIREAARFIQPMQAPFVRARRKRRQERQAVEA